MCACVSVGRAQFLMQALHRGDAGSPTTFDGVVVTFVDHNYADSYLRNAIVHMRRMRNAPPFWPHCLDDLCHAKCTQLSAPPLVKCIRARGFNASTGRLGIHQDNGKVGGGFPSQVFYEALLSFRLLTIRGLLQATKQPVLLVDGDALGLSRMCFDEWNGYRESVVAQAGGLPGCPQTPAGTLGILANMGVALWRPSAVPIIDAMLSLRDISPRGFPYRQHCYDQELFNKLLTFKAPRWVAFPDVLNMTAFHELPGDARTIRFLNYSRWTGINHMRPSAILIDNRLDVAAGLAPHKVKIAAIPSPNESEWCLLHTMGRKNESTFAERGLWYCRRHAPWKLTSSHRYSSLSARRDSFSDTPPPCKHALAAACQRAQRERIAHATERRLGLIYPPAVAQLCGSRLIYLDLGANAPGSSVGKFRAKYPDGSLFHVIAFEPSPGWVAAFAREMPEVELWPYAVGLSNGNASFQGGGSVAAGILPPPASQKAAASGRAAKDAVVVKTLDFVAWLRAHVQPRDYVVCKMDVEGAEHELMPALIESGAATLIDELYLECHSVELFRNGPHHYHECVKMLRDAQSAGIWVHEWF